MSICSMTGYAREEIVNETYKVIVEIKSVNHRYFDINLKMPRTLLVFEQEFRKNINEFISRGKIDCFITYEDFERKNFKLLYNKEIAKAYFDKIKEIATDFNIDDKFSAFSLSKLTDVLTIDELDEDSNIIKDRIQPVLSNALIHFNNSRIVEASNLVIDLKNKINTMNNSLQIIEKNAPMIIEEYRNQLIKKVDDFLKNLNLTSDSNRIMQEVVIYSDKVCIDEEIVRLKSHIQRFLKLLDSSSPIGKELDFITQEMNRETNTMLSKSQNLHSSNEALNLKTTIEKIREQVQNIE